MRNEASCFHENRSEKQLCTTSEGTQRYNYTEFSQDRKVQALTLYWFASRSSDLGDSQPRHQSDRPHVGELLESSGSRARSSSQGLAF